MSTRAGLVRAAFVTNLIDLVILGLLVYYRGWLVAAFAVAGLLVSAAYAAPPPRLKKRGMGEPSVLLIWGPLMVGGSLLRSHRPRHLAGAGGLQCRTACWPRLC